MSSPKGDKTPCARLCHIVKWDDFDGYGFNLHAEKGKNGQYIGKVDEGSPSQAAGLRQGDRIVEVNEINVANESHKQVVERIKAFPCETKLLVVDEEADEYFRANSIVIKGTMANVKVIKTPEKNPNSVEERSDVGSMDENTRKSTGSNDTSHSGSTAITTGVAATNTVNNNSTKEKDESSSSSTSSSSSSIREKNGNGNAMLRNEQQQSHVVHNNNTAAPTTTMTTAAGNGSVTGSEQQPPPRQGLNLKMSAKELRAQLAARKKYDPKKESIGFKDKFDIVQKL